MRFIFLAAFVLGLSLCLLPAGPIQAQEKAADKEKKIAEINKAIAELQATIAKLEAELAKLDPAGVATLKPGTYEGDATTASKGPLGIAMESSGTIIIKIEKLEGKGAEKKVTADIRWADGLFGKGKLTGSFDKEGTLKLKGKVSGFMMPWDCTLVGSLKDGELTGEYLITKLIRPNSLKAASVENSPLSTRRLMIKRD